MKNLTFLTDIKESEILRNVLVFNISMDHNDGDYISRKYELKLNFLSKEEVQRKIEILILALEFRTHKDFSDWAVDKPEYANIEGFSDLMTENGLTYMGDDMELTHSVFVDSVEYFDLNGQITLKDFSTEEALLFYGHSSPRELLNTYMS